MYSLLGGLNSSLLLGSVGLAEGETALINRWISEIEEQ